MGTAALTPEMSAKLAAAMAAGDMAEVIKIASSLKKEVSAAEKADLDAKKTQIDALGEKVKAAFISSIVTQFSGEITNLVGEKKAIINLSWSAEDPTPAVKIYKGAGTKGSHRVSSGGTPQKFSMTTEELLTQFGSDIMDKESGQTFQQAWETADKDKNKRFQVRKKLIKKYQDSTTA
jgi:hypothetical protein